MKNFISRYLLSFLVIILTWSFVGIAAIAADGSNFSLSIADQDQKAVSDVWEKNGGDDYDQQGWGKIQIFVKDLFGLGPTILKWDQGATKDMGCNFAGCDKREPIYSTTIYCDLSQGRKITTKKPGRDKEYYEMKYAVGLYDNGGDGDEFVKKSDGIKAGAGYFKVNKYVKPYETANYTDKYTTYNLDEPRDDGPNDLGDGDAGKTGDKVDDDFGINDSDRACRLPSSLNGGNFTMKRYEKMSDSEKDDFGDVAKAAAAAGGSGGGGNVSGSTDGIDACKGGALGWLFCPLVDGFTLAIRGAASIIESMLTFRVIADGTDKVEGIHRGIVNLANVFLIVAFMVVIFSQATSAGLSSYGIKRILPRIMLGAIFINLSFYICALLIDFSNIAGTSIMGFILGGGDGSISSEIIEATGGNNSGGINFFSATGDVAAGTAIGGGLLAGGAAAYAIGAQALLWLTVPLLLMAAISIFTVMLILIARQVILLGLVLLSPLAFAAWLLPNTEQYFKKWLNLFAQQLILFPMIMLVFGVSIFVASLI